jgi:hypothetical protein
MVNTAVELEVLEEIGARRKNARKPLAQQKC